MATTQFLTSDAETVKAWADTLYFDTTSDRTLVGSLMSDGILHSRDDLSKGAGDTIYYSLVDAITSAGTIGMQAIDGNELALSFNTDSLVINELDQTIMNPSKGTIDDQRVKFDLSDTAYEQLRNYYTERMTLGAINQLAGNTATSVSWRGVSFTSTARIELTGMQSAVAPQGTGRTVYANGNTTDQGVNADTNATFTLSLIEECENQALKNYPLIEPLDTAEGAIRYKMYIHVDGFKQAQQDVTAPSQLREVLLAEISAGRYQTPIGQSFVWSNTQVIATDKLPYGVHSSSSAAQTNTRRFVFCGKNAGSIAFGQGYSYNGETTPGFTFYEDYTNVGKFHRIRASGVWGIKKDTFNSIDYGVIKGVHYVA